MAEKIQTLNIPSKVIDSSWRDDVDVVYAEKDNIIPFEVYGENEKQERETYVDPNKVITKDAQRKIDRIKAKKIAVKVGEVLDLQAA